MISFMSRENHAFGIFSHRHLTLIHSRNIKKTFKKVVYALYIRSKCEFCVILILIGRETYKIYGIYICRESVFYVKGENFFVNCCQEKEELNKYELLKRNIRNSSELIFQQIVGK